MMTTETRELWFLIVKQKIPYPKCAEIDLGDVIEKKKTLSDLPFCITQ